MKKKLLALMISVCTVVSLVGCGSKEISNDNITISQYKGVEIDKVEVAKVTDEDVEANIQSTLEANMISTEITDRAVANGDVATIDYVGKKDGVEFDGGSATDQPLTIGSNSFIEGFETGIIGHNIGDTFDLALTFPADYASADLAGAAVVFTVTVKSIATQTLPELNDKFVATVSKKSKTVDEYKKEVKATLKQTNKDTANTSLEEAVWAAVLDNTKVKKLPTDRVKEVQDQLKDQYTQMAEYYGMTFADFLEKNMGMTEDDFTTQVATAAETSVKQELAVALIAEKAKLEPSDKELKTAYKALAKEYGFADVAALKEAAKEADLKKMVLEDRVKQFLVDNSVQVEPKAKTDTDSKDTSSKDTTDTSDKTDTTDTTDTTTN